LGVCPAAGAGAAARSGLAPETAATLRVGGGLSAPAVGAVDAAAMGARADCHVRPTATHALRRYRKDPRNLRTPGTLLMSIYLHAYKETAVTAQAVRRGGQGGEKIDEKPYDRVVDFRRSVAGPIRAGRLSKQAVEEINLGAGSPQERLPRVTF
jgi:hypothetical protein